MNNIVTFLIEATGITAVIVFLSKFAINWIGQAGLEKFKSQLQNESLKYQTSLEKELETFKIKYTRLHLEQVEIIKCLYSKLIKAEKSLEYLLRPIKLGGKTQEETAKEVILHSNDFFDYFDENEVIFNEETCEIINRIKKSYLQAWNTYSLRNFLGKEITGELLGKVIKEMNEAYDNILNGEMLKLKAELKNDFRTKLGILQ